MTRIRSTTVLGVRHNGQIALGADGQATMDKHVAKNNVRKVRQLNDGKVVTGFAGSTADAFMLLDRFEEKLAAYGNNLKRAAIELAKDWRKDQYLRKLEAMMVVCDKDELLIVSGTGDVLEPDMDVAAIGSGAMYAQAAALALKKHAPHLHGPPNGGRRPAHRSRHLHLHQPQFDNRRAGVGLELLANSC